MKDIVNKKCYYILSMLLIITVVYFGKGCSHDYPIDNDGLLITGRWQCYVNESGFDLLGVDHRTVLIGNTPPNLLIDTTLLTINALVHFGTDLKNLYPMFSLVTDATLEPKVTGLTDFSFPREYTVISGNRKVRKTYTVTVTILKP